VCVFIRVSVYICICVYTVFLKKHIIFKVSFQYFMFVLLRLKNEVFFRNKIQTQILIHV
jgi:hypothetical protein